MILVHGYEQDKIPNTFATSKKTILLCVRTCSSTPCTFPLFYLSMHAMVFSIFGIHHTISELGKPLKNLWSSHCLLSKSYFKNFKSFSRIFFQFKPKFYADMLFFQVCQILGTQKLQMNNTHL